MESILLTQTATFPLASSAGSFTWSFDPSLGVHTRRTASFGPTFAERALTNGKRRLNVVVSFQRTVFDSLAGEPLSDLRSTQPSEVNLSSLKLSTQRTLLSVSYGVFNHMDVELIVPYARIDVSGRSEYSRNGRVRDTLQSSARAEGIGDVVIRGKTTTARGAVGIGLVVDVRLPTGDNRSLLGVGTTQMKAMFVASATARRVAPHVNVSYTIGGKGVEFGTFGVTGASVTNPAPSPEFGYTFGADILASRRLTVSGDLLGRSIRNSAEVYLIKPDAQTQRFRVRPAEPQPLVGIFSAKLNVTGLWVVTGSVLFPLNDEGVKPRITPVVGLERAF